VCDEVRNALHHSLARSFAVDKPAVVINLVEKFLEVQVHQPAVSFGNVLLCFIHRLPRIMPRLETVAVFGERWIPTLLFRRSLAQWRCLDAPISPRSQ
jgi:hypothetical protein